MSKIEDEKYTREGDDDSQVRSIINQLNSDRPSKEKSREVVVRPDGTKVVRVTKKRKVMITSEEKKHRARRQFLFSLIALVVLVGGVFAFMAYRMSAMSSESYLAEKQQELCMAWGAKSVQLVNARLDGMALSVDRVVAEFPETSMIQMVELDGINASLSLSSFFTGCYRADDVEIGVANIRLNPAVKNLSIPRWQSDESLWRFGNVLCKKFNLSIGDPNTSSVTIRNTEARMYESSSSNHVVTLNGGSISFAGMGKDLNKNKVYKFNLLDAKAFVTSVCVEDIRINCQESTKTAVVNAAQSHGGISDNRELAVSDFTLTGRIGSGESLYGPYIVDVSALPFSLLTHGLFERILDATVLSNAIDSEPRLELTLSQDGSPVVFSGDLLLGNVNFKDTDLKARLVYSRHIVDEIQHRKYASLQFTQALVHLNYDGTSLSLVIDKGAMEEKGTSDISLHGSVSVNTSAVAAGDYPLSGGLTYSMPKKVLSHEYEGGAIDPIFAEDPDNKHRCVFVTKLSGSAILPQDDSEALDMAAANGARGSLVRRKTINVEEILRQHDQSAADAKNASAAGHPASSQGASSSASAPQDDIFKSPDSTSDKDFFKHEDPDAIFKTPTGGSSSVPTPPSTVPVDPSVKF